MDWSNATIGLWCGARLSAPRIPLVPDEDTARDWLLNELSKPEYQQAKPNPIDRFFADMWTWFSDLFTFEGDGVFAVNPAWIFILLGIIALVLLAVVLGRPRAIAKRGRTPGAVFFDDDERSVQTLRAAAEDAARAGNFSLAVAERFRAICRGLSDRTLITLAPGATAQNISEQAGKVFPDAAGRLREAATAFDVVRYFERRVDARRYEQVRNLDLEIERKRPTALPELAASGVAGQ